MRSLGFLLVFHISIKKFYNPELPTSMDITKKERNARKACFFKPKGWERAATQSPWEDLPTLVQYSETSASSICCYLQSTWYLSPLLSGRKLLRPSLLNLMGTRQLRWHLKELNGSQKDNRKTQQTKTALQEIWKLNCSWNYSFKKWDSAYTLFLNRATVPWLYLKRIKSLLTCRISRKQWKITSHTQNQEIHNSNEERKSIDNYQNEDVGIIWREL